MKYIDAEKLIAEIERRMNECVGRFGVIHKLPEYRCLKDIRSYVTSLQQEQPEVDLEKEINRVFFQGDCGSSRLYHKEIANIARHFYELGLNARKEG